MKEYIKFLEKNKYSKNTIATYKSILKIYENEIKDIRLIKKKLMCYFSSPNTVWTHYNVLNSYLKWKKDNRIENLKQINLPRIPAKYLVVFSKEYLIKKTAISDFDSPDTKKKKILVKFLFETGLRASEVSQILSFNKKTLIVLGKGQKIREVFHNFETTKEINFKSVTTKTIRIWVKEILGNQYSPHSIRRSFATHLLLRGASPKMVMMQLGHEKIETTFRYLQLSIEQNRKIYDKHY